MQSVLNTVLPLLSESPMRHPLPPSDTLSALSPQHCVTLVILIRMRKR